MKDASPSYPLALAIALPFVTVGYLVPLLSGLAATDWTTWIEGGWPQIAIAAVGKAAISLPRGSPLAEWSVPSPCSMPC